MNGGSFARTGRERGPFGKSNQSSAPGPGQYGGRKRGSRAGRVAKPGYSFGKERRGTELKGNGVPGPGQYSKQRAKYGTMKKRPKSVGTFGTSAQRPKSQAAKNMEASGASHLGPGSYNTHLYNKIGGNGKQGYKFGTGERRPLRDTEKVPGPGNYNHRFYQKSERNGFTFGKHNKKEGARTSGKTREVAAKQYSTRNKFPYTANYALPKPEDRKIKPAEYQ